MRPGLSGAIRGRLVLTRPSALLPLLAVLAAIVAAPSLRAQPCAVGWLPGTGVSGINGTVNAIVQWDPDGSGPRGPVFVFGGLFSTAGNIAASNVVLWDPAAPVGAQFEALGFGTNDEVNALAVAADGTLVVGGIFTIAGGSPIGKLARWNGAAWSAIGSGMGNRVRALAALPNGDLVVGGDFTIAGGVPAGRIARWDGATFVPLAGGSSASVYGIGVLPSGEFVASGAFSTSSGVVTVARWSGSAWVAVGPSLNFPVRAIAVLPGGDLIVGGDFVINNHVTRLSGSAWAPMGAGLNGSVQSLLALPNGEIIAGGDFTASGTTNVSRIARFDGTAWTALGSGLNNPVGALALAPSGDVLAGGSFTLSGVNSMVGIARWSSGVWIALSTGMNGAVRSFATLPNGDVIAGGDFTIGPGAVPANRVARLSAGAWSALGSGLPGTVNKLVVTPAGVLYAGGSFPFSTPPTTTTYTVLRWSGSSWLLVGSGNPQGTVRDMAVTPSGDLIAVGSLTLGGQACKIVRWNGTFWDFVNAVPASPAAGFEFGLTSVAVLPGGDIVVGGDFSSAPGSPGNPAASNIARWTGSAWAPLGPGVPGRVEALAALPGGELVAAGFFSIRKWTGSDWITIGPYSDGRRLALLPASGLILGNNTPANGNLFRWNGSTWATLGSGVNLLPTAVGAAPNGDILVGGSFTLAGGRPSAGFARYQAIGPCPPDFDCSGALAAQDIFDFLNAWFAQSPEANFNGGVLAVEDIFDFLNAWFAGC